MFPVLDLTSRARLSSCHSTGLDPQGGLDFLSVENIDTATATGRCFLSMMGAIHQMERELRAERAESGRASAKARGKTGGRPRTDAKKLENARILYEHSEKTAAEACAVAGVGRRTFFACMAKHKQAHASGSETNALEGQRLGKE